MQEYYKILGLTANATEEEIENAYKTLKDKYSRERFYEGEIGNEAARNLTKVETAYHEIMASKKTANSEEKSYDYSEIEKQIKSGDLNKAQDMLDYFSDRDAEWHYLQSVIFYKKSWINESKKQLEIAMNMDPHNEKYSSSYTKLKQKIEYNSKQFNGGANYNNQGAGQPNDYRQMGGSDSNNCLTFCATWCCMDMLCSICCR